MPVRRGAARRLGLRLPAYPAGLITFDGELSDEAIAEFVERWQTSHGQVGAHQVRLLLDNRAGTFTPSEPIAAMWRDAERDGRLRVDRDGLPWVKPPTVAAPVRPGCRQLAALVAYAVFASFVVLVLAGAVWPDLGATVGGLVWAGGLAGLVLGGALLGRVLRDPSDGA